MSIVNQQLHLEDKVCPILLTRSHTISGKQIKKESLKKNESVPRNPCHLLQRGKTLNCDK